MALINSVLSWIMKKRVHQIELFMKYPHEVQAEWFKRLITVARDTEWGRTYDYKSVTTLEKFRERVPISDYDSLKGFIDRMRAGEKNILWPSDIKLFAKSSGTTSDKSKYIPLSNEALEECHYKGGKDLLSIYCNNNPNTFLDTLSIDRNNMKFKYTLNRDLDSLDFWIYINQGIIKYCYNDKVKINKN
jgi:hypothetical protein